MCVFAATSVVMLAGQASGQTVTVNWSQDDYVDFGGAQQVANLPGPDGHVTIAEAVMAANNTPGPQTIAFAVPRADWWTVFGADVCYFYHTLMLYVSGDDTTIDFTTQAAFTGNTNLNGNEVSLYYAGAPSSIPNLWLAGNRITVKGVDRLLGNNFEQGLWISGNDCRVVGCTTTGLTIRGDYGGGANNTIGGTEPGEGNVFTGPTMIRSRAHGNIVVGNTFRYGLRLTGDPLNGTCDNNRLGGPTIAERNIFSGHSVPGSEGLPDGTELEIYHARNTLVQGNFVGTSDNGLSRHVRTGVTGIGVGLGAIGTMILDNTVAGIERTGSNHYQGLRFGIGIAVAASATGTQIRGNRIGVGVDGVTPILNIYGISVQSDPNGTPNNTVIENNIIAANEMSGVRVLNTATGVRISQNSIFGNGAMGIDLGTAGMTPNDAGDTDSGPNGLQNYPVISGAVAAGSSVQITGSISSQANRSFIVEFFANSACDSSGYGEGAEYLGSAQVSSNGAGIANFDTTLPVSISAGTVVTATATEVLTGNTSEFSLCRVVEGGCAADFNADGTLDFFDYLDFVDAFAGSASTADFNLDSIVDFFDYLDFVNAFSSGC